jgi:hypothetical protein
MHGMEYYKTLANSYILFSAFVLRNFIDAVERVSALRKNAVVYFADTVL